MLGGQQFRLTSHNAVAAQGAEATEEKSPVSQLGRQKHRGILLIPY